MMYSIDLLTVKTPFTAECMQTSDYVMSAFICLSVVMSILVLIVTLMDTTIAKMESAPGRNLNK